MSSSSLKFFLFLWIVAALAACSKQEAPKIVARVGSLKITVEEFRRRFEFTPRLKPFQDVEQAKTLFLGSLIAEKLLAQEAMKEGLADSGRVRAFLDQIQREATIEALYNEKVAVKIREQDQKLASEAASEEFRKYFKHMMVGKKTEVPPARFKYLTERLEEAFHIGTDTTTYIRKQNPSPLNEAEFSQARHGLEANLHEMLVTFDDGTSWTLREFLQRLSVGMYHLDFRNQKKFRRSLREAIVTMIEQEYVYKNAVKEGLAGSPAVQAEVAMWRESIAAQTLAHKLLVSEPQPNDGQEISPLSDDQLSILTQKLLSLSNVYPIEIDLKSFREAQVVNAGLLVLKTHFPGRLAVPQSLPLENLTLWQQKVAEKMGQPATN